MSGLMDLRSTNSAQSAGAISSGLRTNPSPTSALPAHYRDIQSPLASAMMLPNQDRPFPDNPEIKWAWELMPKMQLSAAFTMDAEDAVFVSSGLAFALQVYTQNWVPGAGDSVGFYLETSVTGDDEDFVRLHDSFGIVMQEPDSDFTKIRVYRLTPDFAGYLRIAVETSLGPGHSINVFCNYSVLGKGIL